MRAKLVVVGGKANREEIKLKLPAIVGRSRQAGVCIAHPTVSRQHCELYEEDGKIYVRDLGSLNGTLVADSQVQRLCLEHGDTLTVGPLTFQVVYEHLGAIPATPKHSPKADEDSAIGQVEPPELAQTMVDMPKVGAAPIEELAAPLPDLNADDGFDLALPAAAEEMAPAMETSAPDAADDAPLPAVDEEQGSVESLKLFAADEDDLTPLGDAAPTEELVTPEPLPSTGETIDVAELDDELEFDLAPAPDAMPEPAAAAEDEASEPAATVEHVNDQEDEFLAFLSEQSPAPTATKPAAEFTETVEFDLEAAIEAEMAPPPIAESATPEDELDWLSADAPASSSSVQQDLGEASPTDTAEFTAEDAVEELSFDDASETVAMPTIAAASTEEIPIPEAPQGAKEEPKKKRGLWPFGRKKKAEAPAAEATIAETPAPPLEFDSVEESKSSDETVVMELLDISTAKSEVDAETVAELHLTQELAHEQTTVMEALPVSVEEPAAAVPAPAEKAKRGFFSFGKKKPAETPADDGLVEEAVAELPSPPEAETATPEAAATDVAAPPEVVPAEAAKKRGWWPFGKKGKTAATPMAEETATPAAAPEPQAAPVMPVEASPNPESFEFTADELLEITTEGEPPMAPVASDPQALAADEILDFELDLPLHDSSASIEPVLSDAPPPTTGADDDDFLDFLSEELPGAKSKRASG